MAKDVLKRKKSDLINQMSFDELYKEIERVRRLRNFNKRSRTIYLRWLEDRYNQMFKAMKLIDPSFQRPTNFY